MGIIARTILRGLRPLPESVEHRVLDAVPALRGDWQFAHLGDAVALDSYSLRPAEQMNCVFVHIPKCAGISVAQTLFGCLGGGHLSVDAYRRLYRAERYEQMFKFTIVRNPWDRLASAFHFLKRGGINAKDADFAARELAAYSQFDDFVRNWVTSENIKKYIHFLPQTYYLTANRRTPAIDFLGRFENLQADFQEICRSLGIQRTLLARNQSSRRRDYRDEYTDATARIVGEVYREDAALLGYGFDGPPTTAAPLATTSTDS